MKKRNTLVTVAYTGLILILVLVMIYSGLQILESTVLFNGSAETQPDSKTITRDGVEYFPRQDITVMLISGTDQRGPLKSTGAYNNPSCADMISLAIFDDTNQEIRILTINRDTMVTMPVLGVGGREAGTFFGQIALSHTYGSGMMDSSDNLNKTVSDLLGGIPIDYYITSNMDAINILNDAVGGVRVRITDDFSQIDPTMKKGYMVLKGQQAMNYVRARKGVGNQLNINRMERQKQFMGGFMEAFHKAYEKSPSFLLEAYNKVNEYMITNCSTTVMNSLMDRYGGLPIVEIVTPKGENRVGLDAEGEKHYQFYPDEEDLNALVLRLFYAPKA